MGGMMGPRAVGQRPLDLGGGTCAMGSGTWEQAGHRTGAQDRATEWAKGWPQDAGRATGHPKISENSAPQGRLLFTGGLHLVDPTQPVLLGPFGWRRVLISGVIAYKEG